MIPVVIISIFSPASVKAFTASGRFHGQRGGLALDAAAGDFGAELELDALLLQDRLELLADFEVHAGGDLVEIFDHGDLGAEPRRINACTDKVGAATVVHQATHQLLFHTGVQSPQPVQRSGSTHLGRSASATSNAVGAP